MLRPSNGVTDRRGFVPSRRQREDLGDFEKLFFRNSAQLLDKLRRVPRKVTLQNLKDAPRMLQRVILLRLVQLLRFSAAILFLSAAFDRMSRFAFFRLGTFVQPGGRVVFLPIPSGEESAEILGIFEIGSKEGRCVRVVNDVLAEKSIIDDRVVDERAEEGQIAAGAER